MWYSRKFISKLLIVTILSGLFGMVGANTQGNIYAGQMTNNYYGESERTDEISSFTGTKIPTKPTIPTEPTPIIKSKITPKPTPTTTPKTPTKPTPTTKPTKPVVSIKDSVKPKTNININKYNKVYPYANIEKPARLEGIEIVLQDNVEFLPADASYNIDEANLTSISSESDLEDFIPQTGIPNHLVNLSPSEKTYQPGTNILKFSDKSISLQKGKIYIDENTQSTYRVIDASGEEAAVVQPRAEDVIKSIYIPNQEIRLTKGNITDMAEGVTLVDEDDSISSYASGAMEAELPEPDRSRNFHEFNIPEMILFEMPSNPNKKPVETEQPKGKNEPTVKPTPTPHPENRDAKDTSNSGSLSIVVKLKGGKIRVYEPKLICEADWDGEFNLGFESMTVESSVLVESKIKFEKEMCVRIYGYGLDYDSGSEILGRRIAAHIGVGIYAVIGVNGEITITAKIETVGDIRGGVMGNFWGVLVGVPSALPYAWYDSEDFKAAILLNGKINAWAYVGPQLTLDVLDFNLLTAQVWLGLEAEAIIEGEASEEKGASLQLDLSADFVALFKAWLFNNPFEYYLLKLRIFEKTFQFKIGAMVGGDSVKNKEITPVIQVDGLCAHRDKIWGSIWYEDELAGVVGAANIPLNIEMNRNGTRTTRRVNTDSLGNFEYEFTANYRLLPTDSISISIDHVVVDGDQTTTYRASTLKAMNPTIPFTPFILEADAFNDIVTGTISPCKTPLPGYPEEEYYDGDMKINVYDDDGELIASEWLAVNDGTFEYEFTDPDVLSGGHKVIAILDFEGASTDSGYVDTNLNNLDFIVECLIDGVDAKLISEIQRDRVGEYGIIVESITAEGNVTNLKNLQPYEGEVDIFIGYPFGGEGWETSIPMDLDYEMLDLSKSDNSRTIVSFGKFDNVVDIDEEFDFDLGEEFDEELTEDMLDRFLSPTSSFSYEADSDALGEMGRFVSRIIFAIEYEDITKSVTFEFAYKDPDIVAGPTNPGEEAIFGDRESRVNWPDVMIAMGQSQMRVNGRMRTIDGRGNTSVMMVDNEVFVPIEAIVEALGGTVAYGSDQKLTIRLNNNSIVSYNGKSDISANGKKLNMKAAPFMTSNGTMMFPASFLSDNLGLTTEWSADTNTLSVWSSK
ncbi:MAG: copper amine oxidase N-terminal domain-containing protein [Anaerolineaceae bacterium]|nr:MAG: copper amine oxidase N-terminal domain-containing protein [Anaerolineaceae bacterium]